MLEVFNNPFAGIAEQMGVTLRNAATSVNVKERLDFSCAILSSSGGSHLPDVTVVTPVHEAATGRLLLLSASRAHHAEIGGKTPGSMPSTLT